MKSNFFKIAILLSLVLILINSNNNTVETDYNSIRELHKKNLEKSPFKKNKKLTKSMLTIKPKNPADSVGTKQKGLTAKELAEKLKKLRANKAKGGMGLKMPSADQVGLKKLPTEVRNKMGYMYGGGMGKKPRMSKMDYRKGGMVIIALDLKKKGKK